MIAISPFGKGIQIMLGNGDGTFAASQFPNTGAAGGISGFAVGDFNGDGIPDIVVGNEDNFTVTILTGKGDGTFTLGQTFQVGGFYISIAVADFNGDGKSDLAVAAPGTNTLTILLGNGDGTFTVGPDLSTGPALARETVGGIQAGTSTETASLIWRW